MATKSKRMLHGQVSIDFDRAEVLDLQDRLHNARQAAGMTVKDVCRKAEVSDSSARLTDRTRSLRGGTPHAVSLWLLWRITNAIHMDIGELLHHYGVTLTMQELARAKEHASISPPRARRPRRPPKSPEAPASERFYRFPKPAPTPAPVSRPSVPGPIIGLALAAATDEQLWAELLRRETQ